MSDFCRYFAIEGCFKVISIDFSAIFRHIGAIIGQYQPISRHFSVVFSMLIFIQSDENDDKMTLMLL